MIHEPATVLRIEGNRAWVQCASQAGCQRCAEGKGCGGGLFAALLGKRLQELPIENRAAAQVGEPVVLALDERVILSAALAAYGLPLLGLLLGGGLAAVQGGGDAWAALGGGIGFVAGLLVGRLWSRRAGRPGRFAPVMLEQAGPAPSCPGRHRPMA